MATTATESRVRRWAGVGVKVWPSAPWMAELPAYHCRRVVPAGFQLPVVARSVSPTAASPAMTGASSASICLSLKWMKPVGQPEPVLVMRRQWKSPPHESSETMISSRETTSST